MAADLNHSKSHCLITCKKNTLEFIFKINCKVYLYSLCSSFLICLLLMIRFVCFCCWGLDPGSCTCEMVCPELHLQCVFFFLPFLLHCQTILHVIIRFSQFHSYYTETNHKIYKTPCTCFLCARVILDNQAQKYNSKFTQLQSVMNW